MKVLFYKKEGSDRRSPKDVVDPVHSDSDTLEFEGTTVAHVETVEGITTIYTEGGHFYLTLTAEDVQKILASTKG